MVANENARFHTLLARGVVSANGASNPDRDRIGWVAIQILFLDSGLMHLSSSETMIHYEPTPPGICTGKDTAALELMEYIQNPPNEPSTYSTMLACYAGNVDCPRCKAYLKANKERRKLMGHRKAVTRR